MPVRRSLVLAALFALGASAFPAAGDRAAAATTTRLSQRYEIVATLDVATGRLDAVERVELTNNSSRTIDHVNLSAVPRALGYLEMGDTVTIDGEPVAFEWTTTINLRVPLDGLGPGESVEIGVDFALNVGRSPDAFSARLSSENGVLSFGQWFPIVSTEHEVYGLGDPQISFTADSIRLALETTTQLPRDAVACPGLVEAPQTAGTAWVCEVSDVRDFSFVVNPRFQLTEADADGTAIRVYTETVSGGVVAELARTALIGLGEAFGAYPWPDLVLAEVGAGGGFSMEYPRAIHLTRGKVTDTYVVYHEVAHQWFYGQLGNDQQREPWLDEGFADFSARYLMGIGPDQCSTRPIDSPVFAWEAGPTTGGDWSSCDGYFHTVFYRGTEFLNAIRAATGDDAFFAAMREWVAANRHGMTTARGLLVHLEASTDADLEPIYRAYLTDLDATLRKPASGLVKVGEPPN
ncbi:MAG TPA: M1 family aminopeptidase [Candidatus Limnocylindrales bacterium]|nr:M1 family aminopeptidase [Candidatus Limnocylindrales bacterium]